MNEFKAKADKIKAYNEKQRQKINDEEKANGGFDKWYDSLGIFRDYLKKQYIRINLLDKCYRPRIIRTDTGHIIDHHIISYLAPMEFTRIGWNNNRLSPCDHLKQISDYFTDKGKRFIYCAIPNKGCVYPSIICNNLEVCKGGGWHK